MCIRDSNSIYVLAGAHAVIANQCAACHENGFENTPSTCIGCHQEDFNQTTTPSHVELHFSNECVNCHNETAWVPASFDHDNQYFPIYSGKHEGTWEDVYKRQVYRPSLIKAPKKRDSIQRNPIFVIHTKAK